MTTDFNLMDIAGNFTGMGPAVPDESTGMMSTATTGAVVTPQVTEKKTAFINPNLALKTQPVAPIADQTAYNASIAQQESGTNPNIGFHNKNLSSAYGPYGMTTGAYEDARRVNPALPTDITQANPEQLTQAQNAFTQQNARYLQNYGVPVNENTLAAAHLLGAKGLKDYQDSGYLSPAAIKANGGEANLRNIVEARLGGKMRLQVGLLKHLRLRLHLLPQLVQNRQHHLPHQQNKPIQDKDLKHLLVKHRLNYNKSKVIILY